MSDAVLCRVLGSPSNPEREREGRGLGSPKLTQKEYALSRHAIVVLAPQWIGGMLSLLASGCQSGGELPEAGGGC